MGVSPLSDSSERQHVEEPPPAEAPAPDPAKVERLRRELHQLVEQLAQLVQQEVQRQPGVMGMAAMAVEQFKPMVTEQIQQADPATLDRLGRGVYQRLKEIYEGGEDGAAGGGDPTE